MVQLVQLELEWQEEERTESGSPQDLDVVLVTGCEPDLNYLSFVCCVLSLAFPSTNRFVYHFYRIFLGTLYPAYASYKAIRTKDVKEYVITHLSINWLFK